MGTTVPTPPVRVVAPAVAAVAAALGINVVAGAVEITQEMVDQDKKNIEDRRCCCLSQFHSSNFGAEGCYGNDDVVDVLSKAGEGCE